MVTKPIRGWLLLFCIHGLAIVIANAYTIVRDSYRAVLFARSVVESTQAFVPYVVGRLLFHAIIVLIYIVGLAYIVDRSPRTPRYWVGGLRLCIVTTVASVILLYVEHVMTNSFAGPALLVTGKATVWWGVYALSSLMGAATLLAWMLYWRKSERVRATFPGPGSGATGSAPEVN